MPSIPQYTSKERVTTEPGISKLNVQPGAGEALERSGDILSQLGEKMRRIGNANAASDAALDRQRFEAEDTDKRSKLPTKDALTNIDNDVRKSREETANRHFSDPIGKQEWLRKQELLDSGYIIQTKADVYKRMVSERRVGVLTHVELEVSNGINSADQEGKQAAIDKIGEIVNNPANEDIYNAEDKKKIIDDSIEKINQGIKDQQSLKAKQEKEIKLAKDFARNEREDELIKRRVDDQLTFDEVRNAMDGDNPIDAKVGQSLINSLKSPKTVAAKTDFEVYGNIMDDIIDPKKTATQIKATILTAHENGQLSDADLKSLLYVTKMGQTPIFQKAKEEQNIPTNPFVALWRSITNKFKNPKDRAEIMSTISPQLTQGMSPVDLAVLVGKTIKDQVMKLHDWAMNIPKGGVMVMDEEGNLRHMNEDAELDDEEE